MIYALHQFHYTDELVRDINAGTAPEAQAAVGRLMMTRAENAQETVNAARGYMTHVADIIANNLDNAFEVGNIGPESNIVRHDQMSSVSVGNVLVDEDGVANVVCGWGFAEVDF